MELLLGPLGDGFFIRALVALVLVGVVCAVVGTYVVLRGVAFIGDAIAHAGFPGVVAAYLLGIPFYIGAAVAAVGTALAIGFVTKRAGLRQDTTIGVLFAGTFALGVFMFSSIRGTWPTCSASCSATFSRSAAETCWPCCSLAAG